MLLLISGLFFAFGIGVHPWLRRLPAESYLAAMRSVHAVTVGWPFRLVLLLPASILVRTEEFDGPLLIPTVIYVFGVMMASFLLESHLDPDAVTTGDVARTVARRWSLWHSLRTVAVIVVTMMVLGEYLF
ncbi:hypothetical protein [Catellatospora methionotrophica]|uniref:hypothetical protein n=1 Tax=Catellatospora methionotrophica TaxID=121620 RepID=UPI0033DA6AA5